MSLPLFYRKAPVFIQILILNLKGYLIQRKRFNKDFFKYYNFYLKNDYSKVDYNQLQLFIVHANTSPFWNKRFKQYNFDIKSKNLIKELEKLPVLKKSEVIANNEDIRVKVSGEEIIVGKTSGTTGAGLVFQDTLTKINKQWAIWWRYRQRFNIDMDLWFGWFGGQLIVPFEQDKPPYHRVNYPMKQIMFSGYHLKKETVVYYYNILKERKIEWLHGYPSQISYFSYLLKEAKLFDLDIKFITLGGENLLEHQKEIIKEVFKISPIQHYGLAEGTSNISQLPSGELVIDQDFAYTELIESEVDKDTYHIIGTNYSNLSFPLIRYDSNDLATVEKTKEGSLKIKTINGRNEDFITLPNGVKVGRLDHIFKSFSFVNEAQIYQTEISEIIFRIVKNENYIEDKHNKEIIKEARSYLGNDIKITIKYFKKIKRTNTGKLKFVISNV